MDVKPIIKDALDKSKEINSPVSEENLDDEYIDHKTITISLVHNYSAYRKANLKVLGERKETIGSSITSTRILSSNKGEVEAYFPALIGLSPNNPEFITKVKAWLSNISFKINENDVKLDVSFRYNHKSDYLKISRQEEKIEEDYEKTNRADTSKIKEAIKVKVNALNTLESTKYKYGSPVNLEEYLMYRHCLLYKDVAKDTALINSDNSLRFYIKDENKEAAKRKKLTEEKVKAMRLFVEISASDTKFNSVFVAVCVYLNKSLSVELLKADDEKKFIVMDFVNNHPDKFNKIVNDKHLTTKSFIETLISRGELIRSEYNQQISTADGTPIGANINEAVAYFNNPDNKDVRTSYENKLKLF